MVISVAIILELVYLKLCSLILKKGHVSDTNVWRLWTHILSTKEVKIWVRESTIKPQCHELLWKETSILRNERWMDLIAEYFLKKWLVVLLKSKEQQNCFYQRQETTDVLYGKASVWRMVSIKLLKTHPLRNPPIGTPIFMDFSLAIITFTTN